MPESPHFNNEGAVQHFDFKDEKKSGCINDDVKNGEQCTNEDNTGQK